MRKFIVLCCLFALVCCSSASAATRMRSHEVGGTPTHLLSVVDIVYLQNDINYSCSGAIISPDVILTAAHCAGGHGYFVSNEMYGGWSAQPPIVAPGYSAAPDYINDLAVMRLNENVPVKPLPVASTEPAAETPAISYGWGITNMNGGGDGDGARQLALTIQSAAWCTSYWSTVFVASDMCASSAGTIASGDSGGPLIAGSQIVGINDKAADQAGYPSIFTRTDLLAPWISAEIGKLALSPHVAAGSGMARPQQSQGYGTSKGRG